MLFHIEINSPAELVFLPVLDKKETRYYLNIFKSDGE